ncbi:MAG: SDR family oxidoreductase [Frankia sp.]|nr:SDR family oxidoreductase [Frankia sp.]
MRAVVAGGAGFVGSHLCERLLAEGAEVICLDNLATGDAGNVEHLRDHPGFRFYRRDVTEHVHVGGPVDAVLHLASPASPVDYRRLPVQTLKAGSVGTMNLLGLAREKGARFVLASTSEVYGDPLVHPQREDYRGNVSPVGPRSMYDEAKRYAEALTTAYRHEFGVGTGIVRIFNTYGPRMRPHDGRAIPTFVAQALRGQPLTVAGDGTQTRSVCYVDDLVDGLVRMTRSDVPGPVNLGNPHELTVLELARLVIELCASSTPVTFVPRPPDDPSVRRPDISRARAELGWEPTVSPVDGLSATIRWFAARFGLPCPPKLAAAAGVPAGASAAPTAALPARPAPVTASHIPVPRAGDEGATTMPIPIGQAAGAED